MIDKTGKQIEDILNSDSETNKKTPYLAKKYSGMNPFGIDLDGIIGAGSNEISSPSQKSDFEKEQLNM